MRKQRILVRLAAAVLAVSAPLAAGFEGFDAEDYEEEAGASFGVLFNTEDDIYGASFGSGTWLKGTPVFGDYFVSFFQNDIEDSFYSGLGMTIRIMPRWKVAPFAGAGGSFNLAWASSHSSVQVSTANVQAQSEVHGTAESYWGGHAEGGIRLWLDSAIDLVEAMGRYTWTSSDSEAEYWLAGISVGAGW